jgi:divinyl chlorophyllide a 8-vinyl-reductase
MLFQALGQAPRFKHVPVAMMSAIVSGLSIAGKVSSRLRDKAELARIGRYYATESMLVWDAGAGRYDADATPEFGSETLADHYKRLATEDVADDRREHAVF